MSSNKTCIRWSFKSFGTALHMSRGLRNVGCSMLSLHHTCLPLDWIRQEHLLVIAVACDCTITLWTAKRTQLMSLIASYACLGKPLLVWAMLVNLGLSPVAVQSAVVQSRPGFFFFFLPKNISCSFCESGWRWKKRIWCLFAAHCLFFYSNNDEIEDKYVTREKSTPWLFI